MNHTTILLVTLSTCLSCVVFLIDRVRANRMKRGFDDSVKAMRLELTAVRGQIEDLRKGIVPDYEAANAAANAVNDFSKGISNILGFDPMAALKAEREKKDRGEE